MAIYSHKTTLRPSISILSSNVLSMPSEMVFIAVTETIPITMQVVVNIARVLLVPIEERAILNPLIKLAIKRFIPLYQILVPVIVKIKDTFWHATERADRPLMRRSR